MYKEFGISEKLEEIAKKSEKEVKEVFEKIDEDTLYNSQKVLTAFQKNNVSEMHFGMSTGYGQGDVRQRLHRKNICRSIRSRRCTCTQSIYFWDTCINSSSIWTSKTK